MQRSESIDLLATALSAAQGALTNPERNRTVKVKTGGGTEYEFSYATLDAIMDAIRAPLATNGLSVSHTLQNGEGKYRLITTLMHKSGQWISSEQPLFVDKPGNQAFGSALTYARRYAVTAMLGIAADEDDDSNAADGNTITKKADKGKPDEIIAWATEIRGKIDKADSLTALATLDSEVNKKTLADNTRAFLKTRIETRKSVLMQAPKLQAVE